MAILQVVYRIQTLRGLLADNGAFAWLPDTDTPTVLIRRGATVIDISASGTSADRMRERWRISQVMERMSPSVRAEFAGYGVTP